MCCFSRPIESVTKTKIFARLADKEHQYLVYSMQLDSKEDVAMILPIPTPAKSPEDAVKFISLKEYADFFPKLNRGFPEPRGGVGSAPKSNHATAEALKVVEVGSFDASFVPTIADFSRLDERFRLPSGTWDKLPLDKKFGFAVFKLKAGATLVHPMAFRFPTALPDKTFFPTVHIHDGKVHDKAEFDHTLYLQPANADVLLPDGWEESTQPAGLYMDLKKADGIFAADLHCYRHSIVGMEKNEDWLV
ncbi:MAG TPA: hypothetical protein VFE24_04265 [Pirellulales bacterium]|jgi:hypothetical protein|nr:hypothetical protein [Pirellulales bacterium]